MDRRQFHTVPLARAVCAKCGSETDLNRHHVLRVADGGRDNPGNLAWLCHDCHLTWHSLRRSRSSTDQTRAELVFMKWILEVPPAKRKRRLTVFGSSEGAV